MDGPNGTTMYYESCFVPTFVNCSEGWTHMGRQNQFIVKLLAKSLAFFICQFG